MSTHTPTRCRTLSNSDLHVRYPCARPRFTKVKLLAATIVVGLVMTTYCLIWTTTTSQPDKSRLSELGRRMKLIRMFSTPSQIDLQRQRKKHLSVHCDAMVASGNISMSVNVSTLTHLVVDDKYRLLYCYVPKVGCSNWKRIFLHMTGMFDKTKKRPGDITHNETHFKYANRLRFLTDYSIPGIHDRLRNYRKFMFVREPLERLLSAYRDKFAGVGLEDKTFQKKANNIYKMQHPESPIKGNVKKGDVNFLDFVKYLVQENQFRDESFQYDEHWERQSQLCLPCQINYDYIGKYETIEDDADYLLKRAGLSRYSFPKRSAFYNATRTNETLVNYFSQIPSFYRKRLQKFYQSDYLLFDYKFPLH
ncbi:carbohydrate sulfotransferase 11-like [Mizuhopecten yessoensis]|uniref:carbohydrate sulfotransferase 11-like n=1 Tax=Mizuhopecten yessoensis TaxID=6573 RepID=UPI000B458F58|nr:carbohydrate sulfotransferase 11-like [Mizuhopecten yessoensis]XP_021369324.1 carbohydrate sulfotransferase 11-like [Mizuhopecten yessoensis]XP_021369325.1 carbohydrate sulfotransferase 11-like [Mizuhopecten yessoensis]